MASTPTFTRLARQRTAFALVLLSTKPSHLTVLEYFRLLRSQIKDGAVKEPTHLDSIGLLKERIANLEQEQITLRSMSAGDKRRVKELEDELQKLKDAQDNQTSGQPRKRKRTAKQDALLHLPSVELRRAFGALSDTDELPTLFHSIQLLLYPETTPEQAIEAAHVLSITFVTHFKRIISNPKSQQHHLPEPTRATQSVFALLASLSLSPKFGSHHRFVIAEITIDLVTDCLTLLNELCLLAVKSAIYNDSYPKDCRDSLSVGILSICSVTPNDCSLRQALLLALLIEFRSVRCSTREGRVAILARDDMLWYLCHLIEEIIGQTEVVGETVAEQAERLVWESLSVNGEEEMTKGSWLAWKVCGLLCGIGAIKLDLKCT